jgi:hypothetical protein
VEYVGGKIRLLDVVDLIQEAYSLKFPGHSRTEWPGSGSAEKLSTIPQGKLNVSLEWLDSPGTATVPLVRSEVD